jgi:GMP synthase-like glutamine amidotransferase
MERSQIKNLRLHYFQHMKHEGLGWIADFAKEQDWTISGTHFFEPNFSLPTTEEFAEIDLLIILGGEMSIHDEAIHPWLHSEKQLIRQAIHTQTPILAICLGSQLLAEAWGATVKPQGFQEIGFWDVELTPQALESHIFRQFPPRFSTFHWHGDTFEIPKGATHIFQSKACPAQGYLKQNTVGIQFHPEMTPAIIQTMLPELHHQTPETWVQSPAQIEQHLRQGQAQREIMEAILLQILLPLIPSTT